MKKVYVLKIKVSLGYKNYSETKVFDSYDKAKEVLALEADYLADHIGYDWNIDNKRDDFFTAEDIDDDSNYVIIEILVKDLL